MCYLFLKYLRLDFIFSYILKCDLRVQILNIQSQMGKKALRVSYKIVPFILINPYVLTLFYFLFFVVVVERHCGNIQNNFAIVCLCSS